MGRLGRCLAQGEYGQLRDCPLLESDFLQVTHSGDATGRVTVAIVATSPLLPLPDVLLLVRPLPASPPGPAELQLSGLLPLSCVRLSLRSRWRHRPHLLPAAAGAAPTPPSPLRLLDPAPPPPPRWVPPGPSGTPRDGGGPPEPPREHGGAGRGGTRPPIKVEGGHPPRPMLRPPRHGPPGRTDGRGGCSQRVTPIVTPLCQPGDPL
ncbi:uncharacterized protein LOC141938958 [Strix uralensis]|uniref:uncharacterized protein LOC141938958 n=1 Tax=Strix uralensis TaxID=36305 RepID=UPI003DA6C81D